MSERYDWFWRPRPDGRAGAEVAGVPRGTLPSGPCWAGPYETADAAAEAAAWPSQVQAQLRAYQARLNQLRAR